MKKKKDWGTWVETAEKGKKLKEEIGRQKGQNNSQSVKVKAKSQGKKKSTAKVMKDQDQEEKSKAKPSGKRKKKTAEIHQLKGREPLTYKYLSHHSICWLIVWLVGRGLAMLDNTR